MFRTTLTATARRLRLAFRRLLAIWLIALPLLGALASLAWVANPTTPGAIATWIIVGTIALAMVWLAATRVTVGNDDLGSALVGAIFGTPALLAGLLALTVLVVPLVLVIPVLVLIGTLAADRGLPLALRRAFSQGVRRAPGNIGVYAALLLGGLLTLALTAGLLGAGLVLLGGVPAQQEWASMDALLDWAFAAPAGLALGALLGSLPALLGAAALTAGAWNAITDRVELAGWSAEELEAVRPQQEMSPVVESLLRPPAAGERRRLTLPPRAERAGRLPGPGVMQVAEVVLPAGSASRPVDAPVSELGEDGPQPLVVVGGSAPGAVMVPAAATMWVSSGAYEQPLAAWKQLAAAFSETGLWPLLLLQPPAGGEAEAAVWFEQRARRDRDQFDATAAEQLQMRLADSLGGDSPLASTTLIAASGVASGALARPGGMRPDAIDVTIGALGEARLALVSCTSPGAVVHRTAWPGALRAGLSGIELALVIESWAERYGALLVALSEASLTFAVIRPPHTVEEAVELVAEQHALCPDEAADWADDRAWAAALVDAPTWTLSWR